MNRKVRTVCKHFFYLASQTVHSSICAKNSFIAKLCTTSLTLNTCLEY